METTHNQGSTSFGEHWPKEVLDAALNGSRQDAVFRFSGKVSHSDVEALVRSTEDFSVGANDGVVVRKRLLNVLVEALENVRLHAESELAHTAFALLHCGPDAYRLVVGNAVPSATAELLQSRVELINGMTEADMKEHYLKLLSNSGRTEKGGAGLGLITLARKGARPVIAKSHPRDGTTRFLTVEVRVLRD
ncbi:MAG: hypothetical protein IPJ85_17735 [Flavobacteriales bacterium]|nr:hypothetical protein [Flavobacteriales bacterium]